MCLLFCKLLFPFTVYHERFFHAIKYAVIIILRAYVYPYISCIYPYLSSVCLIPFVVVLALFSFLISPPFLDICFTNFVHVALFTILNYFLKIKFLGIEFLSQSLLGDLKSQGAAFSFHFTSERGSKFSSLNLA